MIKLFDKSKLYNYIAATVFLLVSFWFIKELSYSLWKFDIFNLNHFAFLGKKIISFEALSSLKYLSLVMTLIGTVFITYGGILITMSMDFNEIFNKKENVDEKSITSEALKNAKEAEKAESQKQIENINENQTEITNPEEEKFAMYNNIEKEEVIQKPVEQNQIIKEEEKIIIKPETPKENIKKDTENLMLEENNDDEEREKLQAKIRETIEKMKTRNNKDEEVKAPEKILKHFTPESVIKKSESIDMNFMKISEEDNAKMENTLISAGFKLLSEIRIGNTGIDYLAAAKDKLVVIQLDTTEGNWLASEDNISAEGAPVWFSESGNKLSPISRVITAKSDIENLIKGEFNVPVKPVVCLGNSDIVNYFDVADDWKDKEIDVVSLNQSEDELSSIDKITEIFPPSSQDPMDEKDMEKLISILEKAEIPE